MSAAYTRDAEEKADAFAYGLLERAGISTLGMAAFFDRIDAVDGDLPAYLSTHPASENRAHEARKADQGGTRPALLPKDWQALKAICAD
jgi:predicted Zn-dependent protease